MREIKFRAWKNGNGFAYDVQNEYDSEPWGYKDGFVNCDCFGSLLNRDEIIIEQFTGLYDKNGKEIYEGDILSDLMPPNPGMQTSFGTVQVLFGEYDDSEVEYGSAGIGWYVTGFHGYVRKNGDIDRYNIGVGYASPWSLERVLYKWEIVGNIHENPELIE